jgi:flagellar assembly factor FliW
MKKVITTRFGEKEIEEDRIICFREGLLGFPDKKNYIILEDKPGSPFLWLQSVDEPGLAFVMINPFLMKTDYLTDLSRDDETLLKGQNDEEVLIFSIVTIPRGEVEKATMNLMGPLVIGSESRNARQVILANSGYSHRHPIACG